MIAKLAKGSGFRGVLNYLEAERDAHDKERPDVRHIGGSVPGSNAREQAASFGTLRTMKPNYQNPVRHVSLAWTHGDRDTMASRERQEELARRFTDEMGWQSWTAWSHGDHLHVVGSAINPDGTTINDRHDWRRAEEAVRKIEREMGLEEVAPSPNLDRKAANDFKAATRGEIEAMERTGEPTPKMRVQGALKEAHQAATAEGDATFTDFSRELEARGVQIVPNASKTTGNLTGYSLHDFESGQTFKTSAVARGYTPSRLSEKGIHYEPSRDMEEIERLDAAERERAAGNGLHADGYRPDVGRDQRAVGGDSPAPPARPGSGGDDRPDAARDTRRDAERGATAPGRSGGEPQGAGERQSREREAGTPDRRSPRESPEREMAGLLEAYVDRGGDLSGLGAGLVYSDRAALDRAGGDRSADGADAPANREPDAARAGNLGGLAHGERRQLREVLQADRFRHFDALGAEKVAVQFDPGERDLPKIGQRVVDRDKFRDEGFQRFVSAKNVEGYGVYIQPVEAHPTVMLDDLDVDAVRKIERDGFEPTLLTETSPGNYQALWRFDGEKPDKTTLRPFQQMMTKKYGTDAGAAAFNQPQRLAGTANTKPERGGFKAKVREVRDGVSERLRNAYQRFRSDRIQRRDKENARAHSVGLPDRTALRDAHARFRKTKDREMGRKQDESTADFRGAKDAIKAGYTPEQTRAVIEHDRERDPKKAGHVDDYAARTANAAAESVERDRQHDRQAQAKQAREPDAPTLG